MIAVAPEIECAAIVEPEFLERIEKLRFRIVADQRNAGSRRVVPLTRESHHPKRQIVRPAERRRVFDGRRGAFFGPPLPAPKSLLHRSRHADRDAIVRGCIHVAGNNHRVIDLIDLIQHLLQLPAAVLW